VGRFLDVGCGVGDMALYLGRILGARRVFGVEISAKHAEEAQTRGVDAAVLDIDTEPLPFEDEYFDAVFCGEIIEHLFDTDHLLEEVRRVLSPTGFCIITTPNLAAWYNRLTLLLGFQPFYTQVSFQHAAGRIPYVGGSGAGGHFRVFVLRSLLELVRLRGYTVAALEGASYLDMDSSCRPSLLQRTLAPIDRLFSLFPSLSCDMILGLHKGDN
jgi:SAM-dependent methyltransferase